MSERYWILNDLHFGFRNDEPVARDAHMEFIDWFGEQVRAHDTVILNGDTFDNRKHVSPLAVSLFNRFMESLEGTDGLSVYIVIGNHDIYYRNTLRLSFVEELVRGRPGIEIVKSPRQIGEGIFVMPWVCEENLSQFKEQMERWHNQSGVLLTHMEIMGSKLTTTMVLPDGFSPDIFPPNMTVVNGHIHYPSEFGKVINTGLNVDIAQEFAGVQKRVALIDGGEVTMVDVPVKCFHLASGIPDIVEFAKSEDNAYAAVVLDKEVTEAEMEALRDSTIKVIVKPSVGAKAVEGSSTPDKPDLASVGLLEATETYIRDTIEDNGMANAVFKVVKGEIER